MPSKEALRTFEILKTVSIDTDKIEGCDFDYDSSQYPKFEDSCIISATWTETGKDLTDEELELLNEDADFVYERLMEYIY